MKTPKKKPKATAPARGPAVKTRKTARPAPFEFEAAPARQVLLTDVALRDGHQSLLATRMRTEDMLEVADRLDAVGFWSLEVWGGATFDTCLRFLREDPWERLRALKRVMPRTHLQMLLRGQNLVGYRHYPDDVVGAFVERAAHANAMARRLASLMPFPLRHPVEANAVFVEMDEATLRRLHASGWFVYRFLDGSVRFMCSWATTPEAVDELGAALAGLT